jgi:hypothetical protein
MEQKGEKGKIEKIFTLPLKKILVFCPAGINTDCLALNIIYG